MSAVVLGSETVKVLTLGKTVPKIVPPYLGILRWRGFGAEFEEKRDPFAEALRKWCVPASATRLQPTLMRRGRPSANGLTHVNALGRLRMRLNPLPPQ
jgi:hypothetical protein